MPLLLDRLISRTRLSWYLFTALLFVLLVAMAIGAAAVDGVLQELFRTDSWRDLLAYAAVITYILAILPPLQGSSDRAVEALRPLVGLDEDGLDRLLEEASTITPTKELLAFGAGIALGAVTLSTSAGAGGLSWLTLYWYLVHALELGLLAWCIYVAVAGTRPIAVLHQHLQEVDIFDLNPFEPVGRHSLVASLAFVGGAAINLLLRFGSQDAFAPGTLVIYGVLVAMSALVFFLSMRQTHGVLAAAKDEELQRVQNHIAAAYRSLEGMPAESREISALSAKLGLWQDYERRLKGARTWPYNLGMLRTLGLSLLTPIALNLVQRLVEYLLG